MDITIIYGGNGLADDVSLAAVKRIRTVLEELEVGVREHHLSYEDRTEGILEDVKNSRGVVLATTVEWLGIGGYMQAFLDRCYRLEGEKAFLDKYLMAVTLTSASGEEEANVFLQKAWQMLGGLRGVSLSGYVEKFVDIETDDSIQGIVDRKTEDFYRSINQRRQDLSPSYLRKPEKSEQVSTYEHKGIFNQVVGDETPLREVDPVKKKQKQDIMELADIFKTKLESDYHKASHPENYYLSKLEQAYKGGDRDVRCIYNILLTDRVGEEMVLDIANGKLKAYNGRETDAHVIMEMNAATLEGILAGKVTAQRGFLTGELKAKGNFTLLYEFDHLFHLKKI